MNYSDIADIAEQINTFKKKYIDEGVYTKLWIESDRDCGCYHDCSCSPSNILYGEREETQLEYDHRVERQAQDEALRQAREREQYEQLKAKFEK